MVEILWNLQIHAVEVQPIPGALPAEPVEPQGLAVPCEPRAGEIARPWVARIGGRKLLLAGSSYCLACFFTYFAMGFGLFRWWVREPRTMAPGA